MTVLTFSILIWQRERLEEALNKRNALPTWCSSILLAICRLFALTQIRSIHFKASMYLFLSSVILLVMMTWQLKTAFGEQGANRLGLLAFLSAVFALTSLAAMVAVALWGQGFVFERIFAPVTMLLIVSGLLWGMNAGARLKHCLLLTQATVSWIPWLQLLNVLVAVTIATGIVIGQANRIDDLAAGAQVWAETHQEILRLRNEENPSLHSREFPYRLVSRLSIAHPPSLLLLV